MAKHIHKLQAIHSASCSYYKLDEYRVVTIGQCICGKVVKLRYAEPVTALYRKHLIEMYYGE